MNRIRRRSPLTQEIRHTDVGQPHDLWWPVLADRITDFPHELAVVIFVEVGEPNSSFVGREVERDLRHVHGLAHWHLDPFALQQCDLRQLSREEGLQFEAKVLYPVASDGVSGGNAPGAGFGIEIIEEPFADGVYAPARMKLCFENSNVVPRALQFPSSCQAGESRA